MRITCPVSKTNRYLELEENLKICCNYIELKYDKDRSRTYRNYYKNELMFLLKKYGIFSSYNNDLYKYELETQEEIICHLIRILLKEMKELKEEIIKEINSIFDDIEKRVTPYKDLYKVTVNESKWRW